MLTQNPTQPTSLFEMLHRENGVLNFSGSYTSAYASGVNPVPGTETAARGLALGAQSDGVFTLAQPTNFIGHLTRRVVYGGLQLADRVFGVTSPVPVGMESPFQDGLEVSVEKGPEIECEGIGIYLYSGANMITTGTAVGTNLTFQNGQLRVQQAGENVYYTLTANNLIPVNTGGLRIRAVRAM